MKEKSKKTRCAVNNISGNTLDNLVLNELIKITRKNPPFIEDLHGSKNLFSTGLLSLELEKETLQKRIAEVDHGIENLVLAISKGQKGEVVEVLTKNMEGLARKKEKLQRKLLDLQKREDEEGDGDHNLELEAESLGSFSDKAWDIMKVEDKRRMIRSIVDRISWDGEKLDMILY